VAANDAFCDLCDAPLPYAAPYCSTACEIADNPEDYEEEN
jgi:hypothetical protein